MLKKILPFVILLMYISSTMGLVISHIHCYCENNDQVKLFSLKEEVCSGCAAKEKQDQPKSCCAKKQQVHKEHKGCCGNEVTYLKINADYNTVQPISISNILSFFTVEIFFIDPINKIELLTPKTTFLKEDIPKISGKDMVCFLHQFKMDSFLIS